VEALCSRCDQVFRYQESDAWWDYKSGGFDAKLVKCKECGQINIVKYWFDKQSKREEWLYE